MLRSGVVIAEQGEVTAEHAGVLARLSVSRLGCLQLSGPVDHS